LVAKKTIAILRYHKNDLEIFNYSALEENLLKNSFFGLRTGGRSPKQKNFLASGDRTLTKILNST
jgi:hypothetical protein